MGLKREKEKWEKGRKERGTEGIGKGRKGRRIDGEKEERIL